MLDFFYFAKLHHPWFLLLLGPVGLLLIAELLARPPAVIRVSTGEAMAEVKSHRGMLLRHAPAVLRAVALGLLVFALARPISSERSAVKQTDVIDIMLAVDVSGSMTQEDFIVDRRARNRLYVTKLAVVDFIESRKREGGGFLGKDRVGLLLYAKYAWLQCPLTLDHGILLSELERVTIDKNDEKHSRTAIGSAIGLSVSKLIKSDADSKVIILLTDGLNNEGNLDPITAARLAKDYGIRVYTIGAGATEGRRSGFGALLGGAARSNPIDENALKRIAEVTGAKYYRATDAESLQEAYREIDDLERTVIEVGETFSFDDVFAPYAFLGAMVMGASVFARRGWFEPIP